MTPENAAQVQANGGIDPTWPDRLIADPFMDLVGGSVEVPNGCPDQTRCRLGEDQAAVLQRGGR